MVAAMVSETTSIPPGPTVSSGLDRQSAEAAQAEPVWPTSAPSRSRLRLRTLVTLRWWFLLGQTAFLVTISQGLHYDAPYGLCAGLVGLSCWVNLLTGVASPGQRMTKPWEATAQLTLDILQITGLLYLTGGIANPFALMLIAPVTLAAATLPIIPVAVLGGLAIFASVFLGTAFLPLPAPAGEIVSLPQSHLIGAAIANVVGILIIAGSVRQAAAESARMALALDITRTILAREQRLSALGALAAAAAHELGTPLATIAIVAKELAREATSASVREDAELLTAQAARCREILKRLTDAPAAASDQVHEQMSLRQLLHEVLEPQTSVKGVRVEAIVTGPRGLAAPDIRRMPEVLHALTSFAENAVDFAASEVLVTARYDETELSIEVRDDGPGFAPDILSRLGEPYVSSRPGTAGGRTGHVGMGLGCFIGKTLLERTGAEVLFKNARPHGAVVSARWARARIEVTQS